MAGFCLYDGMFRGQLSVHPAPMPLHGGLFGAGHHLPPPKGTAQFMLQWPSLHVCYSTSVFGMELGNILAIDRVFVKYRGAI